MRYAAQQRAEEMAARWAQDCKQRRRYYRDGRERLGSVWRRSPFIRPNAGPEPLTRGRYYRQKGRDPPVAVAHVRFALKADN